MANALGVLLGFNQISFHSFLKYFYVKKLHHHNHSLQHNIHIGLRWIKITKSCPKKCFYSPFIFFYIFYQCLFSRTCYEQLREDFLFNLAVLDERDQELARYDSLTAKALTVNPNRYSNYVLWGLFCVFWNAFLFDIFLYYYYFYIISFQTGPMAICSNYEQIAICS